MSRIESWTSVMRDQFGQSDRTRRSCGCPLIQEPVFSRASARRTAGDVEMAIPLAVGELVPGRGGASAPRRSMPIARSASVRRASASSMWRMVWSFGHHVRKRFIAPNSCAARDHSARPASPSPPARHRRTQVWPGCPRRTPNSVALDQRLHRGVRAGGCAPVAGHIRDLTEIRHREDVLRVGGFGRLGMQLPG